VSPPSPGGACWLSVFVEAVRFRSLSGPPVSLCVRDYLLVINPVPEHSSLTPLLFRSPRSAVHAVPHAVVLLHFAQRAGELFSWFFTLFVKASWLWQLLSWRLDCDLLPACPPACSAGVRLATISCLLSLNVTHGLSTGRWLEEHAHPRRRGSGTQSAVSAPFLASFFC
jgi:hypothetical protein